jgi:hypothetical protein
MNVAPVGASVLPPSSQPAAAQGRSFGVLLQARTAARTGTSTGASPAMAALAAIDRAQARVDAVLAAARAGRTFTAAELIGLQTEAYRCAQTVDLASKLAEQGAQSVKQALNTQI